MTNRKARKSLDCAREFVHACPGGTVATLQIDSAEGLEFGADWGPPMSSAEWEGVLLQALVSGVVGLIGWTGTAMLAPDRRRTLVRALGMTT
jgi:hypothetical protein